MSSQEQGIPLFHAPQPQGYRLIELPPALESLLTSDNPPTLTLEATDAAGLLKIPGPTPKTYSLRQKNTSNALILLSPHTPTVVTDGESSSQSQVAAATAAAGGGLAAIATIQETVELEEVKEDATTTAAAGGTSGAASGTGGGGKAATAKGKWHERFGRNR